MCKYSTMQFVCLKTAYNKPFNWENAGKQNGYIIAIT